MQLNVGEKARGKDHGPLFANLDFELEVRLQFYELFCLLCLVLQLE